MAMDDDRTGEQPGGSGSRFSLGPTETRGRVRDEQVVASPKDRLATDYLPGDLYVQLQDNDGRPLFDVDGRPVMVRHLAQKPRTATRGIYAILGVLMLGLAVNVVLAVIGLVELHHLLHPEV